MDENSVSSQIFLILFLSYYTIGSESQIEFLYSNNCQRNTKMSVVSFFFLRGGGGGGGVCAEAKIFFSEKNNFIRHFARFNFSRLSLAFILKYYPILHVA